MKFSTFFFIFGLAGVVFAQDAPSDPQTRTNPLTLASGLLEHDFVNVYAYGDGMYDSESYGGSSTINSWGEEVGGGLTASHAFRNGFLSLSYQGAYRNYGNNTLGSGTYQNLSFAANKQLTRRWGIALYQTAGIFLFGGTYFTEEPVGSDLVSTNPFSPETRFVNSGLSVTYQQTRRLSFSFSGDFLLDRYNYAGAIGITGTSGGASAQYRLSRRTSFGGGYIHSYYAYQHGAGNLQADNVYVSLAHQFASRWNGSISAGVVRSNAVGTIPYPVAYISNGQIVTGYVVGHYDRTSTFPSFQGTLSHNLRRTNLTVTAGQGLNPGNGFVLASRTTFVNGFYSYNLRGSNIGFGGTYIRYASIANSVSNLYNTTSFVASYSKVLTRYFGATATYNLIYYPEFSGRSDNRVTFGLFFSSKSVPMTLF